MFKSIEAEFRFFNELARAKGTVRRCARNAWLNGLKQGRSGLALTNSVRGEVSEIIVEDHNDIAYLYFGREAIQELLDALSQELNELANLQN